MCIANDTKYSTTHCTCTWTYNEDNAYYASLTIEYLAPYTLSIDLHHKHILNYS